MTPPTRSRRSLLRTGAGVGAVLATGSLAGCLDSLGGPERSSDGAGSDPLPPVPPSADAVATVDVDTLLEDGGVRTAYDAYLAASAETSRYDGPETMAAALDDLEESEGFDPRELAEVTVFGSYAADEAENRVAFLLEGSWEESAVLSMIGADEREYTETSYADHTVHAPGRDYADSVGVLGDGRYVVGDRPAVEATIDVEREETEPIDGAIADTFRSTTAGPVRYAARVEESLFPEAIDREDGTLDLSSVRAIDAASGGLYRDGTTRGLRLRLHVPDDETAAELEEAVRAVIALARSDSDGVTTPAYLRDLLEEVSIGRSGAAVVLTVERTVDELEAMATDLSELSSGAGGSGTGDQSPAVNFEFDHAADAGTVTITHTAGDTVDADHLSVRGEGFADAADADMTDSGPWSGRSGDDGKISAGDGVVVGVRSDCLLRVVWEREDRAVTLAQYAGPDA